MGDANKTLVPKAAISLIVRQLAHVDEAYTAAGFVSKTVPLSVSETAAKRLLAAHPYLTTLGA